MRNSIVIVGVFLILSGCSRNTDETVIAKAIDEHKADNFDEAVELYQKVVDEFPQSPRVPEALYAMASIYHDHKKDSRRSVELYNRLVNQYPDHPTTSNSLFLVGFIYNNELKNVDSARVAYEEFIRRYPNDHLVNDARFELQNLGKDPADIIKAQIEKSPKETKTTQARKSAR